MSDQNDVCCTLCKTDMATQFGGASPTRQQAVISGNVTTPGPCFVADVITFQSPSMLIFDPPTTRDTDQNEYAVICRKLIVQGGKPPTTDTPCNPGDPGSHYGNSNVITWAGRLHAPPPAAPIPAPAPQPAGTGLDGINGQTGNSGTDGASPAGTVRQGAAKLVIVALEVQFLNAGNLVIDWAGQNGGDGGQGQLGGNAGSGTTGSNGSDEGWPSSGCASPTGAGGNGGTGGAGGAGGNGGAGGAGGQIVIIGSAQDIGASGVFNNANRFTYVTKSLGGKGGPGSHGGTGGAGGEPGSRTSSSGRYEGHGRQFIDHAVQCGGCRGLSARVTDAKSGARNLEQGGLRRAHRKTLGVRREFATSIIPPLRHGSRRGNSDACRTISRSDRECVEQSCGSHGRHRQQQHRHAAHARSDHCGQFGLRYR